MKTLRDAMHVRGVFYVPAHLAHFFVAIVATYFAVLFVQLNKIAPPRLELYSNVRERQIIRVDY